MSGSASRSMSRASCRPRRRARARPWSPTCGRASPFPPWRAARPCRWSCRRNRLRQDRRAPPPGSRGRGCGPSCVRVGVSASTRLGCVIAVTLLSVRLDLTVRLIIEPAISGTRQFRIWWLCMSETLSPPATGTRRRWITLVVVGARPAHGRARRDSREHRSPLGPGRSRLLGRRAPVGHHGVLLAFGASSCSAGASPTSSAASARSSSASSASPSPQRWAEPPARSSCSSPPVPSRACSAPCSLPRLSPCSPPRSPSRRSAHAPSASSARSPAPVARRAAPRRRPDGVPRLALEPLHQRLHRRDRPRRGPRLHPAHRAQRPAAEAGRPGHPARVRRALRSRLRLLERRDRRLGRSPDLGHARPAPPPADRLRRSGSAAPRTRSCRCRSSSTETAARRTSRC